MSILHAIVLGLVQGLTEFLPVSSSGHLILVPRMLGWERQPLAFDVALHQATTLVVLIYFWRDFVRLIQDGLHDPIVHRTRFSAYSAYGRLAWLIVLGCVPAVIVGGLFNDYIDDHLRSAWLVAALLVMFGVVMLAAERARNGDSGLERLDWSRSLFIGAAQALALLPGVSRSGATISAGMFSGLSRATAARFSFLIAAPVIVGAGLKELPDIRHASEQGVGNDALAAGFIVAFVSGFAAIHWLLRWVAVRPLNAFVWYRFAFAAFALIVIAVR